MFRQVLATLGWRQISRPRAGTGSWLWVTVPTFGNQQLRWPGSETPFLAQGTEGKGEGGGK